MKIFKIYVTDDDEDDRMFIRDAINKVIPQAKVIEVTGGLDLFSKLAALPLKDQHILITLDMNMPQLNGIEVLRVIKANEKYKKFPTVMLTTSESSVLKQTAYALGIDSFITKPFTLDDYEKIATGLKEIFIDRSAKRI